MTGNITTNYLDAAPLLLKPGGIGILRTDTLYGIVGRADDPAAVERMYALKKRTPSKPPIVLISSVGQLYDHYDATTYAFLATQWPGPKSIILPTRQAPEWIHRGTHTVAYRLPDAPELAKLIEQTGPLIAPSANPEGLEPAMNITEALQYFHDDVDIYVNAGTVTSTAPSQLLRYDISSNAFERLR